MLKFMSLSSGSCGNCYYLETGRGAVLIDAGVSLRRLKKVFLEHGLDMDSFSAVLVTHDHLDHIRHLGSFCKRLRDPSLPLQTYMAPFRVIHLRHRPSEPAVRFSGKGSGMR